MNRPWKKPEITEPEITYYRAAIWGEEPAIMVKHILSDMIYFEGPFKPRKCDIPKCAS